VLVVRTDKSGNEVNCGQLESVALTVSEVVVGDPVVIASEVVLDVSGVLSDNVDASGAISFEIYPDENCIGDDDDDDAAADDDDDDDCEWMIVPDEALNVPVSAVDVSSGDVLLYSLCSSDV